jgi:hypothetical protein
MNLPFSREEFFELFAAYNAALWPAVVVLWVTSVVAAVAVASPRRSRDRWISALLAGHWVWSAIAYHMVFFTRINPAAWVFAAIFLLQAALFVWWGVIRGRLLFKPSSAIWSRVGWFLIAYALLYPFINAVDHKSLLKIPAFGVPCPTTIFTAGMLLLAAWPSRILAVVPILWSAIGGSAAALLGVSADYALPVAGTALAVFALRTSRASSIGTGVTRPTLGHITARAEPFDARALSLPKGMLAHDVLVEPRAKRLVLPLPPRLRRTADARSATLGRHAQCERVNESSMYPLLRFERQEIRNATKDFRRLWDRCGFPVRCDDTLRWPALG